MQPFPNLVGPSYPASSVTADCERTVNLYPERIESAGARKPDFPYCLLPTPGFTLRATLPTTPVRGIFGGVDGKLFGIGGDQFYEIASDWTVTNRGAVTLGGVPTFAYNGATAAQVAVASGGNCYIYNTGTHAFTQVLTGTAQQIGYLNNRFLALDRTNNKFRVSALSDGTSWPGAGVALRSAASDGWQALLISHRLMWLIGSRTGEAWYDAGVDADQPFVPDQSGFLPYGIVAPDSLQELDSAPIWLQQTHEGGAILVRAEGYSVKRLSTHAFEHAVRAYSTITDAQAYTEQIEGHSFYVLNFPTAQATWAYDAATGLLCERGYWKPSQNAFQVYRPNSHAYAFGVHLVGDRQSGGIYEASPSVATEMDGTGIRRLRRTPHLTANGARLFLDRLQLVLDSGSGLVSGQGSDPIVMLRCSKDGGQTWGNERGISAGALGQYGGRVIWDRLGVSRDWVIELTLSDPVIGAARWIEAYLSARQGTN